MEKFGIFELLDALSAITAAAPPSGEAEQKDSSAEPAAEKKKKTPDAAFAPPAYGTPEQTPAGTQNTALGSFMARHDAAKERAKKS